MEHDNTPPPFVPKDEMAKLDGQLAALDLDETARARARHLADELGTADLPQLLDALLGQAANHAEDVANAEAAGYLRGRNEKIEVVTRPATPSDDEDLATPVFPVYRRRSVWD